jgi:hypothetical protein
MILPLSALLVAVPLVLAAADRVPTFDVHPSCDGALSTAGAGRGANVCVRSELAARDELAQKWSQFPVADRAHCVDVTTMTRMPSYVQVLTCLEMARDARQLKSPGERTTVGAGH